LNRCVCFAIAYTSLIVSPHPYALRYGLKVGVITSILVGLSAAKAITEKRLEFFREAGSGYDVNAYYLATNIISTIEHSIQMFIVGVFAVWLRASAAAWYSYIVQFIMLGWLSVSWALFLPLIVSPKNVVLVVGFFMAFFGLLLGGTEAPIMYSGKWKRTQLDCMVPGSRILNLTQALITHDALFRY
jgi:hypothetical protein